MSDLFQLQNDPAYLSSNQYYDSGNLSARILIHQKFSTGTLPWYDFIFDLARIKPGMKVLEIGCGSSALWRGTMNRLPESTFFALTDLSHGMAQDGKKGLKEDRRFGFLAMNSMETCFEPESFDLVVANHMLYHVPSVREVLGEVTRLMKPGAVFMAATNGPEHMIDLDLLQEKFSKKLAGRHGMSSRFNLVNGEKQLREFFNYIELHIYPSDLWVTDAALLTSYSYSTPLVIETLGDKGKPEMTAFYKRRINHYGGIMIRKETGVYIARLS